MIATTVFSTVLLIATISIIFVSKTYARSQIIIKTQNSTQSVLLNISNAIKYNKLNSIDISHIAAGYFCIGNNVYTFSINSLVGTGSSIGLVESFSNTCASNSSGIQLLSNNERLGELDIVNTADVFHISLTIDYGNNQVLQLISRNSNSDSTLNYVYRCIDSTYSVSFCYVDPVSTTVVSRLID